MTKFEEMRLRAFEFQKRTDAFISFEPDLRFTIWGKTYLNKFQVSLFVIGDRFFECTNTFSSNPYDTKEVSESEWLASIEAHFEQPFPSLLEAQGWIELKDGAEVPPGDYTFRNQRGGLRLWKIFEPMKCATLTCVTFTHYRKIEFGGAE